MTGAALVWALLLAAPEPWVIFQAPAFTGPVGPHGGPDWSLATPRLPAVSPDGASVLVARAEIVAGGAPNLTLAVLRASDGATLSSHAVLAAAEFGEAARAGAGAGDARAFADLAGRVRGRLAAAEAALAETAFRPMTACRVREPADATQPACAAEEQEIDCAGSRLRLRLRHAAAGSAAAGSATAGSASLRGRWRGRALRLPAGRLLSPAPVRDTGQGEIAVRACFEAAWFDDSHGTLVGQVRNECQRGGDWCIVQPGWLTARLR